MPSLRAVSTTATRNAVDGYLVAYGDAIFRTWSPDDASEGNSTSGKYDETFHVSTTGLDLRSATSRTLLGAFLAHALELASAPMTAATLDRIVASVGASPALANRTDATDADRDRLLAELASQRDDKNISTEGMYRRMRTALLTAKAATTEGEACRAEYDAALTDFFTTWEKTTYASAIYYLNLATVDATAQPVKGPASLRSLGNAIGLIQSFRGISQGRRTITDSQIDTLLNKLGADAPFKLVTDPNDRTPVFTSAMQDIAGLYGFSEAEVESFKRSF
jgi:hypothetical protein